MKDCMIDKRWRMERKDSCSPTTVWCLLLDPLQLQKVLAGLASYFLLDTSLVLHTKRGKKRRKTLEGLLLFIYSQLFEWTLLRLIGEDQKISLNFIIWLTCLFQLSLPLYLYSPPLYPFLVHHPHSSPPFMCC